MSARRSWWADAVVYQLYVRSYSDSGSDGIGDLGGIRKRLGHLARLGVDAIWLNPCYPSPQHDHGYDVSDYFSIEPDYGDLAEFDALVHDARQLGIKILMDVVPNHCSWDHEWFRQAVAAGRGSPERQRFYFAEGRGPDGDEPPNNWLAIFGGPTWTRVTEPDGSSGQWYLHVFTPQQPDLNWNHPDVADMFDRMLTFWFDRGVEGFRADAVTVAGKTPGLPDADTTQPRAELGSANPHFTFRPEGHVAWKRWRALVDQYNADNGRDVFVIAEAYTPGQPDLLRQYVNDEEFHQTFSFDLMLAPWHAPSWRAAMHNIVDVLLPLGLSPAWTLNNHDAHRSVTRYGRADATDPGSYTGDNLVNSQALVNVEVGTRRARAALVLMLSLPGAAYLYMGEELGLPEVLDLADEARQDPIWFRTDGREAGRDGCRVPLPWTADAPGSHGFSMGARPAPSWLPQPADWGLYAIDAQDGVPTSVLNLYCEAVAARKRWLADADHEVTFQLEDDPDLVVVTRGHLLIVMNAGASARSLPATLIGTRRIVLSSVVGHSDPTTVPANGAMWLAGPGGS